MEGKTNKTGGTKGCEQYKQKYLRHHPSVFIGRELSRVKANLEAVGVKDGLLLRQFLAVFLLGNRHLKNATEQRRVQRSDPTGKGLYIVRQPFFGVDLMVEY